MKPRKRFYQPSFVNEILQIYSFKNRHDLHSLGVSSIKHLKFNCRVSFSLFSVNNAQNRSGNFDLFKHNNNSLPKLQQIKLFTRLISERGEPKFKLKNCRRNISAASRSTEGNPREKKNTIESLKNLNDVDG